MVLVKLKGHLLRTRTTQVKVARGVKMTPTKLSRLIRGQVRLRNRDRRPIAKFLQVPESRLFPARLRRRGAKRGRQERGAS
jgi:hypothetical protein